MAEPTVVGDCQPAAVEISPPNATDVLQQPDPDGAEPGEERTLIAEGFALLVSESRKGNRGGRPTVIDEPMKARIATLMGAGLSLRQAAACLGISHATISRAVAADEQLKHDVEVARTRATLHPLACILRESGKNWKAAVWLLEHLKSISLQEKTMLERARVHATQLAMSKLSRELEPHVLAEGQAELDAHLQSKPSSPPPRRRLR